MEVELHHATVTVEDNLKYIKINLETTSGVWRKGGRKEEGEGWYT